MMEEQKWAYYHFINRNRSKKGKQFSLDKLPNVYSDINDTHTCLLLYLHIHLKKMVWVGSN